MRWAEAPLRQLCSVTHGSTPSKTDARYWGGEIPWVSPKDMYVSLIEDASDHITDEAVRVGGAKLAESDSVLVVVRSGVLVHRLPLARTSARVAFNQDIKAINPITPHLSSAYLLRYLQSMESAILNRGVKKGATVHSVQGGYLEGLLVPLPPLSEQRRIVELLDQTDALRRKRAEADATAEHIRPALFRQMFGDPALNPKRWPQKTIGSVIRDTAYGTSVRASPEPPGVPVLRMNNITPSGQLDLTDLKYAEFDDVELEKQTLHPGELLFNRTNTKELVGKTGLWQGEMTAVAASYLIRVWPAPEHISPEFLWAWMNTRFVKQRLFDLARRAVGMANINASELRSLPVVVPPLDLQRAFSHHISRLNELALQRKGSCRRIDELFQLMLHNAFTGALTVRWREGRMAELLEEMEHQTRELGLCQTGVT